jgi:NADH:ubiquinone reductase (H+-translocating)
MELALTVRSFFATFAATSHPMGCIESGVNAHAGATNMPARHRVAIIGGGFGGLSLANSLKHAPADVTLLDRVNYHLFQPLLYQVATGSLSPANIASPLREVLRDQKNVTVLLAEATHINVHDRRVILSDGAIDYDTVVIATGSSHQYFGHSEWERFAPGLKTIEDATAMRAKILLAFEAAEREAAEGDGRPDKLQAWLTFVIVGGGPTGVELAGALGEIAKDTLRHEFRDIDSSTARIIVVEGTDRILPTYPPKLSAAARKMVERLGVTVRTSTFVTGVAPDSVTIREGDRTEKIATRTILWAAGVLASPLGECLARDVGVSLDTSGRIAVQPDLTIPGHPEIFVIGDLANFSHQDGKPLPGVAQPAIQEGRYVGKVIERRLKGQTVKPFRYKNRGNLAVIGRGAAVADLNWMCLSGWPAWVIWIFIHLANILQFRNRLLVLLQWGWLYATYDRSARLITGRKPLPLDL